MLFLHFMCMYLGNYQRVGIGIASFYSIHGMGWVLVIHLVGDLMFLNKQNHISKMKINFRLSSQKSS